MPIFQSATFAHPGVGKTTGFDYSRSQNPTCESLEYAMAELEDKIRDLIPFDTKTIFIESPTNLIMRVVDIEKNSAVEEKLRFIVKATGDCLSPFDCFLISRGRKTLPVRMDYQQESALKVVDWLSQQEVVENVYYPGLKTHPRYEISKNNRLVLALNNSEV